MASGKPRLNTQSVGWHEKIMSDFGVSEFPHAQFYAFPNSLRFELGGEKHGSISRPVHRFLRALDRARAVAEVTFGVSGHVGVLVSIYGGEKLKAKDRRQLGDLGPFGVDPAVLTYVGCVPQGEEDHIAEFGEDLCRHWFAFALSSSDDLSPLLWCSIAREMPISPSARWPDVYFVDAGRGLVLHVYDDRGMDVSSVRADDLRGLYRKFGDWLLDYDRPRMDALFGERGTHPVA